ncbi:aminotransferase class III-fold pyridoxal phosphate-dependent enzyme [bacterium]|nr:aminotransferase class III-fold pyridoxal phosphate-dependent enzyme [bacterium]
MKASSEKLTAINQYKDFVSSAKVRFFEKYGMDFVMGKRKGSYIHDLDGKKELINLHCNGGVFNLGHRNPEIIDVLKKSLEDLDIGNHHLLSRERAELAGMLSDLMPGDLNYTVFGVSGGEAIDLALKVARGYTKRTDIISAKGGYHGHTGLALAAGDAKYREPFNSSIAGFKQVPFNDLDALKDAASNDTAAIILETIPATLGIKIPDKKYIQGVRKLCDEYEILLIMDEVQTGLGRTGKLWAFEHFDIIPDIVVLGKGLSGGIYPISATVIREPLESVFHKDPFIHISTFGGSELGCRVAKRVLEISSSSNFLNNVNIIAEQFNQGFEKLMDTHKGFLIGLRQMGLMMGIEMKDELCGPVLTKTAYDHGLLMVYANNDQSVCQCLPPLTMTIEEVNIVLRKLDKALKSARKLRKLYGVKQKIDKFKNLIKNRKGS